MALFSIIDALFIGTHWMVWGISVVGIPVAVIMVAANLSLGMGATAVAFALLLLAAGLAVLLMPKVVSEKLTAKLPVLRHLFIPAIALCAIACIIAGGAFFLSGALPELNLLFV